MPYYIPARKNGLKVSPDDGAQLALIAKLALATVHVLAWVEEDTIPLGILIKSFQSVLSPVNAYDAVSAYDADTLLKLLICAELERMSAGILLSHVYDTCDDADTNVGRLLTFT
jgi:hypothetical protein